MIMGGEENKTLERHFETIFKIYEINTDWLKSLPRRVTPTSSLPYQYQIKYAGPEEIQVAGSGQEIWAEGLRLTDGFLLECKFIDQPDRSPFIAETATTVTTAETFNAEAALSALVRTVVTVGAGGTGAVVCDPWCAAIGITLVLSIFGSSPVQAPTFPTTDNELANQKKDCKTGSGGSGGGNKPPPKKTGGSSDDEPPQNRKVENSNKDDKVRTPETHPKDFTKLKGNQGYRNNNTNESWQRSHTSHKGDAWKVFNGRGQRVGSVKPDGTIVGK